MANEDTLLQTNVSLFAHTRNICCGHKMFVRETKIVSDFFQKHFVCTTNVSWFAQHRNKILSVFPARLPTQETSWAATCSQGEQGYKGDSGLRPLLSSPLLSSPLLSSPCPPPPPPPNKPLNLSTSHELLSSNFSTKYQVIIIQRYGVDIRLYSKINIKQKAKVPFARFPYNSIH